MADSLTLTALPVATGCSETPTLAGPISSSSDNADVTIEIMSTNASSCDAPSTSNNDIEIGKPAETVAETTIGEPPNLNNTSMETNEEDARTVDEDGETSQDNIPSEDGDSISTMPATPAGSSTPVGKPKRAPATKRRTATEAHHDWWNDGTLQAHQVYMYRWPNDRNGQKTLLQEQISLYLGIKSFKRRYPDFARRAIGMEEMNYLKSCNVVSATQLALGLTALAADDVFELMASDFSDKYEEFQKALAEREKEDLARQQKEYQAIKLDSKKLEQMRMKAMRACSDWSYDVNHERMRERNKFFDLSTMIIQTRAVKPELKRKIQTNFGAYPAAVISGQYQNYYRKYTPKELRRLPVSTVTDAEFYAPKKSIMEIADEVLDENCEDYDLCIPILTEPNFRSEPGSCDAARGERGEDTGEHCAFCQRDIFTNDRYVECSKCSSFAHPSCVDMPEQRYLIVKQYDWDCMECKPCSLCSSIDQEDKMLFCDRCDRGYHTFCVGLDEPPLGNWHCPLFCKTPAQRSAPQPPTVASNGNRKSISCGRNPVTTANLPQARPACTANGTTTMYVPPRPTAGVMPVAAVMYTQNGNHTPVPVVASNANVVVYTTGTPVPPLAGNSVVFSSNTPVMGRGGSPAVAGGVNSHSPDGPLATASGVVSGPPGDTYVTSPGGIPPAIASMLAGESSCGSTPCSTPGTYNGISPSATPKTRIAPNEPPFLCEDCDREFSSKWNLQRHITQQHESCKPRSATAPKRIPAICKECGCKLIPQNRAAGKRGVKNMRLCRTCAGQD